MSLSQTIDQLYRQESRPIYATLVRLLGDMSLAEEAMHEAFHIALLRWEEEGIPKNPRAWIISTARFKAIDQLRRNERFDKSVDYQKIAESLEDETAIWQGDVIEDDQLRLIFTCCHPALDPKVQVPLTLREVCGLTTEEIASAFFTTPSTMAQRIVRGKAKIRAAKMPFEIPEASELPQRLDTVLSVIYLVFNEGYSASQGADLTRVELSAEAIRLARRLNELISDSEVTGLLALMILNESRRKARTDSRGNIVLLEHQNRQLWDQSALKEGGDLVRRALASEEVGFYTLQAAISASHAQALRWEDTNWPQIVSLYDALLKVESSPVIELNRAVALAMRDGPEAGLAVVEELLMNKHLQSYHLLYSTHGELLRRAGQIEAAKTAFEKALGLTQQAPEQRLLQAKLVELSGLANR